MTVRQDPFWLASLREGLAGRAPVGVEIARGVRPPLLAADAVHALTSVMFAALIVAAAIFRAQLGSSSFDLIALLLRTAGVAFTIRALSALARWGGRIVRHREAEQHSLAWSEQGMCWRGPHGEQWAERSELVGFALPEERSRAGASLKPLYVVLSPRGRPRHWALPPYFASSADILHARLSRTFGPTSRGAEPAPPRTDPEARYLAAARGTAVPGDVVVPEGTGYRLRAPYGVLLALLFVADAVYSAGPLRPRLLPAAGAAALIAVGALLGWFAWMRKRRATRLGIALLLTPEELLIRGSHGVVSLPWTQLARAEVQSRLAWSPFVGSYSVRVLRLEGVDGSSVPFDSAFLGVPAEVVAALVEAYREGKVSPASMGGAPASSAASG